MHDAINMLGLAKRVKAKIFQASTSEVYGDPEVHPQTEDYWGRVVPNFIVQARKNETIACALAHALCLLSASLARTGGPLGSSAIPGRATLVWNDQK